MMLSAETEELCEYEKARLANIERGAQKMREIGVRTVTVSIHLHVLSPRLSFNYTNCLMFARSY